MAQAETVTLTLTMEEITEDSYKKQKVSFKLELSPLKELSDKGQSTLKEDHCITSEMALVEIAILCNFFNDISSDEGGLTKSGNKFNYLKYLRAPI